MWLSQSAGRSTRTSSGGLIRSQYPRDRGHAPPGSEIEREHGPGPRPEEADCHEDGTVRHPPRIERARGPGEAGCDARGPRTPSRRRRARAVTGKASTGAAPPASLSPVPWTARTRPAAMSLPRSSGNARRYQLSEAWDASEAPARRHSVRRPPAADDPFGRWRLLEQDPCEHEDERDREPERRAAAQPSRTRKKRRKLTGRSRRRAGSPCRTAM